MTKKKTGRERENPLRAIGDITDSRRAERDLRALEEQWRSLVENIPDIIMTVDADGTILFINRTLSGHAVESVVGASVYDYAPPEHHDRLRTFLEKVFETGEADSFEMGGPGPFGRPSWYFSRIGPVVRDGTVVAAVLITTDITEQRRAEGALRESEERFRELVENVNEAIYEADAGGRITYISPVVERVLGYSPSEIIGRSFAEFIHPDDLPTVQRDFRQRLAGIQAPGETRVLSKSGEVRWVRSFSQPISKRDRVVGLRGVLIDITERKAAEEALRQSEERFRSAFEDAAIAMAMVAPDGRLLQVNRVSCRLLGYSEQELKSTTWQALTHPEDVDLTRDYLRRMLAGETDSYGLEKRFIHKDGHVRWGNVASSLVRDADGKPLYFISHIQDIGERKRAEEALRESEERYRYLVETARDVIYTVSRDGMMLTLNPAFEAITGWSRAEWLGKPFAAMIHPDDVATATGNFRRLLQGEVPPVSEIRMLAKSGEYLWGEFAARPLIMGGKMVGSFGIARDVTERKRMEEALRQSERRYRDLVENISEAIYEADADGRMTYIAPAIEEVTGYTASEIVGRPFTELIHPDDLPAVLESFRQRLAGKRAPVEYRVLDKSGEVRWVRSFGRTIREGDRVVGIRGVLTDITEIRLAEEALRQSEDRYRTLVEAAPDVIYTLSRDGTITSLNSAFESISGWSRAEWLGKHFVPIIHPDDLPAAMKDFGLVLRGEVPPVGEYRMLAKAGQYLTAETVPRPLIVGGKVVGTFGIARDISERKRMEEALQKAREELESRVERKMERATSYGLTFRELTILHLMADGRSDREIGTVLGISNQTAHKHVASILSKMGVASRTEASVRAVREGLLD